MTRGAQRIIAWTSFLVLLGVACIWPVITLDQQRSLQANQINALELDLRLANRQAEELDSLRAQVAALDQTKGPDTAPFWPGPSPQAALLTAQEQITAMLRQSGLTIERVEGRLGPEDRLDVNVQASGDIAAVQTGIYALETRVPHIAVARLQADLRPNNGAREPLLDVRLDLQALHIEPMTGQ